MLPPASANRTNESAGIRYERRRALASLARRRESLQQESASRDDSHWPSIPAWRGPSPAARVTIPRRELLPLGGSAAASLATEAASVGVQQCLKMRRRTSR